MQLHIGNKNYSSWSMRSWVLMRQAGIAFHEVMLRFDDMGADSAFRREIRKVNPAGRVPVLVDDGLVVWDTLAIAEYLAEKHPAKALWPVSTAARARARAVCAEMHSGFAAIRQHLSMNIEAKLSAVGRKALAEHPELRADVERIVAIWRDALDASGGPLLFGAFGIADATFAPVVMRFRTYGVEVPSDAAAYMERVGALEGVKVWVADALAERTFVPFDEPYRTSRDD